MKERIEYIDVAKGILTMCLLYGHSYIYGNIVGVDEEAMHLLGKTFKIYGCFFMQAIIWTESAEMAEDDSHSRNVT